MPLQRATLALSLLRPGMVGPVDLLAVYFPEADAAGHQFWDLHDPGSPRRGRNGGQGPTRDPLERVYGAVDRAVGVLVEGYDPDALFVVSDHGMGGSGNSVLSLNRFLEKAGYLKLGGRMRLAAMDAASGIARAAVMRLPARLRERAAEGPRGMADASMTFMRFAGMDWKRSEAFSEDLSYAPSIWINRLSPKAGDRVKELVRSITRDMVQDPVMKNVVASPYGREELYSGPHIDRIPEGRRYVRTERSCSGLFVSAV